MAPVERPEADQIPLQEPTGEGGAPPLPSGTPPDSSGPADPDTEFPSRISPLPVALLVVATTGVVAVSAHGSGLILPPMAVEGTEIWLLRALGALSAALGVWLLFFRTSRAPGAGRAGRGSKAESMRNAGLLMAAVTILALIVMPPGSPGNPFRRAPPPGMADDPSDSGPGGVRSQSGWPGGMGMGGGGSGAGGGMGSSMSSLGLANSTPQLSLLERLSQILPLVLLVLLGLISFVILFRRRRPRVDPFSTGPPLDADQAHSSLLASMKEVAMEQGDPRGQITAAYYRLLVLLEAAGAPRKAQEAPHEHLLRVLGPLGVPPGPLHRVAELYVLAQFSRRPVTEEHRTAAWNALQESLGSLRPLSESREVDSTPAATTEAMA